MSPFLQSKSPIDREIDLLFIKLKGHEPDTDEYKQTLDRIVVLEKLHFETKRKPISYDTLAIVGANLLGILLILKHEELNPITTKAMGTLLRAR